MATTTPNPQSEITPRQFELVHADLGLCLHLYQSIELSLKAILPHLVVPGTDTHAPGEGFENWRVFLNSKETLGPLIRRLAERTEYNHPETLEREWRKLVDHRHEIVHHFIAQPFGRLATDAHYREAREFLRIRRLHALPMYETLQEILKLFIEMMQTREGGTGAA